MSASDGQGRKVAIIVGAGPAGLTAALELLRRSDIKPMVFEADSQVGGLSKTINYRGNRMDLGGHRFFSKSDWVMRWWQQILPLEPGAPFDRGSDRSADTYISTHYQNRVHRFRSASVRPHSPDAVMLLRRRLSRIFYNRRFFDYPLTLNLATIRSLGLTEAMKIGASYGASRLSRFAHSPAEVSLEDFFINRFGRRLYQTFFKDYTEKVWGVPCQEISAEWGAQRIKGLSVAKAVANAWSRQFGADAQAQKQVETSLIEQFLYPKFGPGQMWEEVAHRVAEAGGLVHLRHRVVGVECRQGEIIGVRVLDLDSGSTRSVPCEHLISTMPVKELIQLLSPTNEHVGKIASKLPYRDFMTVGLLLQRMTIGAIGAPSNSMPPDNWIYVQEPDVRIGRLQIFNNWSPAMIADPNLIWLGLEYFCDAGDDLWSMQDGRFIDFAAQELEKIGMIDRRDVLDATLVRVPKAYPAYFGSYAQFASIRAHLDQFRNLYPIGRNGMHRYNNQDHSMLAADAAVTAMVQGRGKKDIWEINAEEDYLETISESRLGPSPA